MTTEKTHILNKQNKFIKKLLAVIGTAVFWLVLWAFAAHRVGIELILPGPIATLSRLNELLRSGSFYLITGLSLLRIFVGTLSAMAVGIILAAIAARFSAVEQLLSPIITITRATPVVSFIILAFLWLGNSFLPIFIAFLMVFPLVYTNVKTGIEKTPPELQRMANVFRLGLLTKIKRIYIPSAMPYFTSAARSSFGLAWKAGVAAEVLVCTQNSIGLQIYNAKTYLETVDLFAWTALIIILSLVIETVFSRLITSIHPKGQVTVFEDK